MCGVTTFIYIDGNNLHRAARELGHDINYQRMYRWLQQRYGIVVVKIFIGYISRYSKFYSLLQNIGYIIVFKEVVHVDVEIKGNCDAELMLHAVSDFYETGSAQIVLVSGDGDFGCLVAFFRDRSAFKCLLAPSKKKCSYLLRNKNIPIVFLDEHYKKFSTLRT